MNHLFAAVKPKLNSMTIHAALVLADLLGSGLARNDNKKPYGITMFAFQHRKPICWDCSCVDFCASTHVNVIGGKAAVIETAGGTYSDGTNNIVRDNGRRSTKAT